MLCKMNPWEALAVRSKCVELCRMPALAITLSLDHNQESDTVAFVSGLLLGNDQTIRLVSRTNTLFVSSIVFVFL